MHKAHPCHFSKAYVPKVSGSEKYRSYLSLMPEDIPSSEGVSGGGSGDPAADEEEEEGKRQQILSEFRALSYEDQIGQRISWAKDLERTENEILELKERLAFKTAWCGVLRRNLGISRSEQEQSICKNRSK